MAITCKQIAEMAGVSRQAAASVLNNAPKCLVSKEKKAQIEKLARELHYVHNNAARTLRKGKSGIIGILSGGLHLKRTGTFLVLLDQILRKKGYLPMIIYTRSEYENIVSGIHSMIQQNVEAIIINGIPSASDELPRLKAEGLLDLLPTIITNTDHPVSEELVAVRFQYDDVISKVVEISKQRNFTRVQGFLRKINNEKYYEAGLAIKEIIRQLECEKLPEREIHKTSIFSPTRYQDDLMQEVREAMKDIRPGTLYLCDTGLCALQVTGILLSKFGRVPEEYGVVAFDHTEYCNLYTPGITSVVLDMDKLAEMSWEALTRVMKKGAKEVNIPIDIQADFAVRETFNHSKNGG